MTFFKEFIEITKNHLISYTKEATLDEAYLEEDLEPGSDIESQKNAQAILQDIYKKGMQGTQLRERYNTAFNTFAYAPFHFIIDRLNIFFKKIGESAANPYFFEICKYASGYYNDHKERLTELVADLVVKPYEDDKAGTRKYNRLSTTTAKLSGYDGIFSQTKFKDLDDLHHLATEDRQINATKTALKVIPEAIAVGANTALRLKAEGKTDEEIMALTSSAHFKRALISNGNGNDGDVFSPQKSTRPLTIQSQGAAAEEDHA